MSFSPFNYIYFSCNFLILFSRKLSHEEDATALSVSNRIDERTVSMENHMALFSWRQGCKHDGSGNGSSLGSRFARAISS